MATFKIIVFDDNFHPFRRWLLARDGTARIRTRSEGDDLWGCRVKTRKFYLKRPSRRRWGAK